MLEIDRKREITGLERVACEITGLERVASYQRKKEPPSSCSAIVVIKGRAGSRQLAGSTREGKLRTRRVSS